MEMVCIICPNGCRLSVESVNGEINVEGAKCKRGQAFAKTELTCPTRSVTSSVKTSVSNYPVVSVRTAGEIPKDKIFDLIRELSKITVDKKLPIGTIVLKDVFGTGVDVITTAEMT